MKNKHSGFISLGMLLVTLSIASILALGGHSIICNYNEKNKIDELIQHEERIRDAFDLYVQKAKGNIASLKESEGIIKFMLREQLLPAHTGKEKEDISYWLDNRFGSDIKVTYTGGAWINISSEINSVYAKRYYTVSGSKNNPSFEEDKRVGHRYMLPQSTAMLIAKAAIKEEEAFKRPFKGQAWSEPKEPQGSLGVVIEAAKTTDVQQWASQTEKSTW